MNNQIDDILQRALTPAEEADGMINQTILNYLKEDTLMKPYHKKRISVAVLVAILILCFSSITVYAIWKYRTANELAEEVNDVKLADAFLSENAMIINETQSYGDYQVTLLSIVSGENLSDFVRSHNNSIHDDRTYIAVAIEYADGSPMPDTSEDTYGELEFCVSPLVTGFDPLDVNIFGLNGNYADISEDGILYRLLECDNLMILADYALCLCVSDTFLPERTCYRFDSISGSITRNEEYDGLNALFQLSLDHSLADAEAAASLLNSLVLPETTSATETSDIPAETTISQENPTEIDPAVPMTYFDVSGLSYREWIKGITADNVDQLADIIDFNIQIIFPDEDGYLNRKPMKMTGTTRSKDLGRCPASSYSSMEIGSLFVVTHGCSVHNDGSTWYDFTTCTRNADGSYTFAWYTPKPSP